LSRSYRVAILGATGAVGKELIELLATRNFPLADLKLLASPRSAGTTLSFKGETLRVESTDTSSFQAIDLVLASAGGNTSKALAPRAVASGAIVIDNSSAYRMDPNVPLIIPEVNPQEVHQHQGIIANPNCTTILMNVVVWPLHQVQPIKRIVASTYQSASGAGAKAMAEVISQSHDVLDGKQPNPEVFPYPLAFNLFLHNSPMTATGYCEEELKMINETRKIFGDSSIRITATCVRVPILRAHSEALNLEFHQPLSADKAKMLLQQAPGVRLVEDWQNNYFPMPIEASGLDEVLVGRIRQDLSHDCGLDLWLSGDQIRKGAALNAVQIAELLISS